MPKAPPRRKPAQPATTPTAHVPVIPAVPTSESTDLPIVYDKLEIVEYSTASAHGPLTVEDAKTLLRWETEKEYQQRMVRENPESRPEHWLFGDAYHCEYQSGTTEKGRPIMEKVRCWNNANNRPFDMGWCEELIHTVLQFHWAGPLTLPGETINGETVRVSRHGRVLSGQHQLTAEIIADEMLQRSRAQPGNAANPKYPTWNGHTHVVLETIVITGLSEDERVLQSIDYVKPRTLADMLYTMRVFRERTSVERKEMTRMLATSVDFLWDRTDTKGYKTHTECAEFLKRHPRLLQCVERLFVENGRGRSIGKLRLSVGQCAALLYIMGSSGPETDGDAYRNECPPSERNLDWSYWDKAQEFWARLASDRAFMPVRTALGRLVDSSADKEDNQGLGGRAPEKLAILAKAWEVFRDHVEWDESDLRGTCGPAFRDSDLAKDGALCLHYSDLDDKGNKLPDGQVKLIEVADFYGIDSPEVIAKKGKGTRQAPPDPPSPTREQIERATQEALARRQAVQKK